MGRQKPCGSGFSRELFCHGAEKQELAAEAAATGVARGFLDPGALLQLDLPQPLLEVALRGDRLGVAARVAGGDRRRKHVDQEVRVRVQEERNRVPRLPRLRSEGPTSELQSLMRN